MSENFQFKDIKLQWLQLLSSDKELSDSAKCVALYLAMNHLNEHGVAWPSERRIADGIGKGLRTVQRAVAELRVEWFALNYRSGYNKTIIYTVSNKFVAMAIARRNEPNNVVGLHTNKGVTDLSKKGDKFGKEGCQKWRPNLERKPKKELNGRASQQPTANRISVNSNSDPELFRRCGELTNRTGLINNNGSWSFHQSVVEQAQRDLAAAVGAA